jgi:hypothetical protein
MHGYAFCGLRKPAEGEFPDLSSLDKPAEGEFSYIQAV